MSENIIPRRDFLGRLSKVSLGTFAAGSLSARAVQARGKDSRNTWKLGSLKYWLIIWN